MKKNLNKNSLIRYSRQIILKNIGIACLILFYITILLFEKSNIRLLLRGFNEN